MKIFINNFMDYITNFYKNKVESLNEQIKYLENQLKLISEVNAWSPPSGGPAIPENEGGNIELENRMRNIRKPKGDQTDEYKAMEAELNRRRGISSTPNTSTTPTNTTTQTKDRSWNDVPTVQSDSTTPDWVNRYAKSMGVNPAQVDAVRRGVIDTLGGDPTKPMDDSLTAKELGQRGVDAYNKAKAYVVNLQQQAANKTAQTPQTTTPNVSGTPLSDKFNLPQYRSTEKSLREPSVEPKPTVKPGNLPNAASAQRESGLVDPDQQRGQFPIYPEGQTDSSYEDMPKGAYSPKPYWAPKPTAKQDNIPNGAYSPKPAWAPKTTSTNGSQTKPTEPQSMSVGSSRNSSQKYVVPESEEWNNLSDNEKVEMASRALMNGESHLFFGGRPEKTGGFLGIGGKETGRFSEDNSGQTPEETSRLNRHAKMLNQLISKHNAEAMAAQAEARNRNYEGPRPEFNTSSVPVQSSPQSVGRQSSPEMMKYLNNIVRHQNTIKLNKSGKNYSPNPYQNNNTNVFNDVAASSSNEDSVEQSPSNFTLQTFGNSQQKLDDLFRVKYGKDKFNLFTPKQRNGMALQPWWAGGIKY